MTGLLVGLMAGFLLGLGVVAFAARRRGRAGDRGPDDAHERLAAQLARHRAELAWLRGCVDRLGRRLDAHTARQLIRSVVDGTLPDAAVLLVAAPEQIAQGLDPAWGPAPDAGRHAETDLAAARATDAPVVLDDDAGEGEPPGTPSHGRATRRVLFPLRHAGEVLGVLSLRYPAHAPFPDDLKQVLAVAAAFLATTIVAARGRDQAARGSAVAQELTAVAADLGDGLGVAATAALPELDAAVRVVAEVAGLAPAADHGETAWRRIVEAAQAVTQAAGAALLLVDDGGEPRRVVGAGWWPEKELRLHLAVTRGMVRRRAVPVPVTEPDTREGGGLGPYLARAGLRALAAAPVHAHGSWVGSLYVCFRQPRPLSALEGALLTVLAGLTALSVHADRLLAGQRRLVTDILAVLDRTLEAHDPALALEGARVGELAARIGAELGLGLPERTVLWLAGRYCDVGRIRARAPGDDPAAHALASTEILAPLGLLRDGLSAVLHHHERFDGTGGPHGLRGFAIPLGARVLAAATVAARAQAGGEAPRDGLWRASRALRTETEAGGLDPRVAAAALRALRRLARTPAVASGTGRA